MITNKLRKLIKTDLSTITSQPIYYRLADENAVFPHIVFTLESVVQNSDTLDKQEYSLIVDLYDKSLSDYNNEALADDVINYFNNLNQPTNEILPTFFYESKRTIVEEDKTINHKQININVQVYGRSS